MNLSDIAHFNECKCRQINITTITGDVIFGNRLAIKNLTGVSLVDIRRNIKKLPKTDHCQSDCCKK
jgi:hypothetical protein